MSVYEIEVPARVNTLPEVSAFIQGHLEEVDCPPKAQMQLAIAVEELFVNIANYAYTPHTGMASIRIELCEDPKMAAITFTDAGKPFNPLARPDPDVTLSAEERRIGGLGIYMTKKAMDDMRYSYQDGQNILTIVKKIG